MAASHKHDTNRVPNSDQEMDFLQRENIPTATSLTHKLVMGGGGAVNQDIIKLCYAMN